MADGQPIDTGTTGRHSFTVTAISRDGQRASKTVGYIVLLPDNRFTVTKVRTRPSGKLRFGLTVPGPGIVDVMETSRRPHHAARAGEPLQPKPWRFAFARMHLTASSATTMTVTVRPDRRGRRLIARHPRGTQIRLWVSYTPTHGTQRNIGIYGVQIRGQPRHRPGAFTR